MYVFVTQNAPTKDSKLTLIARLSSNRLSMELKGEEVYTRWAYSTGRDLYSETWSVGTEHLKVLHTPDSINHLQNTVLIR